MFATVLLLLSTLLFLHPTVALECYKCGAYGKDDPSECQFVDNKTTTMKCKDDEKYCVAEGHNFEDYEGNTKYTNIRRCDSTNTFCYGAVLTMGDNLRNCQVCITDKCNAAPLVSVSGSLKNSTVDKSVVDANNVDGGSAVSGEKGGRNEQGGTTEGKGPATTDKGKPSI